MNKTSFSTRYAALDVFRGMTVAGMIIVNNPGSWSQAFAPLKHSAWNGCTPTDLVFPFFLFCVGVSMAFSFAKYNWGLNANSVKKLLLRGTLIFLIGLGLNAFPFFPIDLDPNLSFSQNYVDWLQRLRILGVLQMIGLCYVAGGIIALCLKTIKKISIALVLLLVSYWIILRVFGGEGWMTLEGNVSNIIDNAILGENHMYHGYGIPFEPEGFIRIISGSCTVLLGYLIGLTILGKSNFDKINNNNASSNCCNMLENNSIIEKYSVVAKLYTIGLVCLLLGCIIDIWFPINKPMWTSSYVLYSGGLGILILAFFIYFVDIKKYNQIIIPFKALGMNPLSCYVGASLFVKIFNNLICWSYVSVQDGVTMEKRTSVLNWFYQNCCVSIFGDNGYASLMYSLVLVGIILVMAMWLYKKKIVIKI